MNCRTALVRRLIILGILSVVLLAGCGGGATPSANSPPDPAGAVAVSVSPASASIQVGTTQQFTATVSPSGVNQAVAWSVSGSGCSGANCGTISSVGMYTAPASVPNPVTVTVTATSVTDSTKSGSATVTIASPPPPITPALAVIPSSPAVRAHETIQFTANEQVSWSLQEGPAGGTISSNGTYTAPQTPGLYHVIATAVRDSLTVTVLVTESGFSPSGNLASARLAHTATLLRDGRVLIVGGGMGPDLVDGFFTVSLAELFDPASVSFIPTGNSARDFHTATLLQSGQVLLAGGEDTSGNAMATAELYDPSTGSFHPTGSMSVPREFHTATLLKDGKVLIAGGDLLRTAEIYDPATGAFSVTGSMNEGRSFHAATLLADGRVLISGGCCPANSGLASAEVYDPTNGSFTSAGTMMTARWYHTMTLLPDGTVLVTGSVGASGATAEVYDPVTAAFTPTGSMSLPRVLHSATLLLDGTVLIAGGTCFGFGAACAATATAEVYDPTKRAFTRTADLAHARFWHTATLLPDGRVLLVGGADSSDGIHTIPLSSAEIYR